MPEEQVSEETQDQTTATPEVQAAPGPWAKDLAEFFSDDEVRGNVDTFLREKVQPYVTKLEGERAPEQAVLLYNDLNEDPASTFMVLTEDLFGPEVAQSVVKTLAEAWGETPDIEQPATQVSSESDVDPRLQKLYEKQEQEERDAEYQAAIDAIVEYDDSVNPELLAPFLAASEGDPRQAYLGYTEWVEAVRGAGAEEEVEEAPAEVEEAPAVLGSDVQTPSSVPTEKTYDTIDNALDDFLAETRTRSSAAPGTVGAV